MMSESQLPAAPEPTMSSTAVRWVTDPVEESLHGARQLTIAVVDRSARDGWEPMARIAGISRRRWRRHHPLAGGAPLFALVEGEPAFNQAAWERFVSLVPGAVALPSRTAAAFGVSPGSLRPPGRRPMRVLDLVRARRAARRLRRVERTLAADVARAGARIEEQVMAALAPGDAGAPFEELPAYALAARFEQLLRWDAAREAASAVDLACATATGRLLYALMARGVEAGDAYLVTAQLTASRQGGASTWRQELREVLAGDGAGADDSAWMQRLGWHSMRALHLDAAPLSADRAALDRWLAAEAADATDATDAAESTRPVDRAALLASAGIEQGSVLADLAERSQQLTALREQVGQHRVELHAGLRALAWTLADRLVADGVITARDALFDCTVGELLAIARGGPAPTTSRASRSVVATDVGLDAALVDAADPASPRLLRGVPASVGVVEAPLIVLDDPGIDAPVAGAIIVCRMTDPGWMPLLMRCAGIVTERGGPLSHAAIVARELGIPAIVGTAGARATVRAAGADSGRLDGAAGTLDLLR